MKKQYCNPQVEVVRIDTGILCSSPLPPYADPSDSSNGGGNLGGGLL